MELSSHLLSGTRTASKMLSLVSRAGRLALQILIDIDILYAVAIGPVVFDIRYITNEYTEICGLRNLVSTEEQLANAQKSEYLKKTRKPELKIATQN